MKNRCLAQCNYSIRGLSVNLPNHSKCFYSNEEVTGENDCNWTERSPATSPITTHTMKCLLMDKCTLSLCSLQHPTCATPVSSKCGDRCIDEVHHWADILITCNMVPCVQSALTSPVSIVYWGMDQLWACYTWKSGLEQKKGTKENPTRWKSTPPFYWFPDKHNDNNFLTIWCLLLPPVAI